MNQASNLCDITAPTPQRLWRVWAKWSKTSTSAPPQGETYHPLICHMLDVAIVARHLWAIALPTPTRQRLTRHLGLSDEDAASAWFAFFTGLHDIGKASPGFQDQLSDTPAGPTIHGWMREAGLPFTHAEWAPHGQVSARVLGYLLDQLGVGQQLADQVAALVGGHHGIFPRPLDLQDLKDRQQIGMGTWDTVREELVAALRSGLRVPDPAPQGELTPGDALVFAGFVTVADWIGSNERYFHHAGRRAADPQPLTLSNYAARADQETGEAVREVRMDPFLGSSAGRQRRTFANLFPSIKTPYDAQRAVIELGDQLTGPALVILEAPMGEGKTEASLYLADVWAAAQGRQGMYIALPTQATSNQMFDRVRTYLGRRFTDADYVAAHLVYGEALLSDAFQEMLQQGRSVLAGLASVSAEEPPPASDAPDPAQLFGVATSEQGRGESEPKVPLLDEGPVYDGLGVAGGEEGTVIGVEWFGSAKRALLAPFGVGTVDQALLGILQTRHFFVRLFGLAGKTVIVDEVHAYDIYMSALLERLLEWLGACGVPVVLLSATLPREKRTSLLAAYARYADGAIDAPAAARADEPAYPRLTWASTQGVGARSVAAAQDLTRRVTVEWLEGDAPDSPQGIAALCTRLSDMLAGGGCAVVICNTVARAQTVYTALKPFFPRAASDGGPVLDLFHARYPRAERTIREQRVLRRFGRGSDRQRPDRAVLVATQVVEQSLDLDFDVMVSDLAPVDLLLQRCGRLHRHRENDATRPPAFAEPRLLIPRPAMQAECPVFASSDEFIYEPHVLLRTWLALQELRDTRQIELPAEIETLVEQVYDSSVTCPERAPPAVRAAWETTRGQLERDRAHDISEARMRRVPPPKDDAVYTGRNLGLKDPEDAPEADDSALALTRLGPPSVRVVLLPAAEAQREQRAKSRPTDLEDARRLLGQSVPIAHAGVARALIEHEPPARWKKSPWLRHARLLALDGSNQALVSVPGKPGARPRTYTLTLDNDLGVVIQRQVAVSVETV